jgi:DHA1 family tetracycline resistance protein-like MFS transporter
MFFTLFRNLRGNSRACLAFEPLFLIPFSMFTIYATVYMYQMGLSETTIGWISSLGLFTQFFSSLISGYLTDRLGRRAALLYFDILSWTVATLLWALADNVWFFVIAAFVNGFQKIPNTAFYCLLVEDSTPKERIGIFTALQFISVVGGMFAPLGGLLVSHFTLIPAVRIMYFIAFVCMTILFFGRNHYTHETEIGLRKLREAKDTSLSKVFIEYAEVIRDIGKNHSLLLMFGIYILFQFQNTLNATYLSLYMVEYLQMKSWLISVFPAISAIVMMLSMWLVLPRIPEHHTNKALVYGMAISLSGNVLLTLVPPGHMIGLTFCTILTAIGAVVIGPILESAVANAIDDEHRAKMLAVLSVLILGFISPAGIIGGWAYHFDPRIPFLLVGAAFIISILFMRLYMKRSGSGQF